MAKALAAEKLRRECDTNLIDCQTTQDLIPLREIIGQERAIRALKFGIGIKDRGFNVYAAGYPGTGKTTAVRNFLEETARNEQVPSDWCYVNNFHNEYEPKAIRLPPSVGKIFRKDMEKFIEGAKTALPKVFESEEYSEKRQATVETIEEQTKQLIEQTNEKAKKENFVIQRTPVGLLLIPLMKGKPVSDEEFRSLSQKDREGIQQKRMKLETELRSAMRQVVEMDKKVHQELEKMDKEVTLYAIGHLVSDLAEKYKDTPAVATYLKELQEDILENVDDFVSDSDPHQQAPPAAPYPMPWMRRDPLKRYGVNVIVDNSEVKGAPVVTESNPTYQKLVGRIEKEAQFGALVTDFTMIRPGSLHKANGGYLIVPVEELLRNQFSYEGLKRSLKHERIVIEELEDTMGFMTTKSLRPEPIPLSVKVVLIGDPNLYRQLFMLDMEFEELFKVKADFDTTMDRTDENMRHYAAFVCTLCQKENLKHLDKSGLAKLVEHSSRLAEDQLKLSTRFSEVADIVREANYYATQEKAELVSGVHVKKAIEEKIYRSKLVQEKIQEMIKRGFILIDTESESVGQVNGLSVMSLGDFEFGGPSRVTATVGLGREGVVDIEREAKMGGPIHTKGVLILSGYINEKYARDKPLSLSSRLVFEQNYEGVEGDSASSTELYSILSALSGLPIRQNIAVTGSVNQKGEVQAIGGVNEKIEGFYEVCKVNGLTGKQGVMIPESNVQNLMLKEEIVEAAKQGRFHVYPVKTIDEGIEVLTGVRAGTRNDAGRFEEDSVNDLVDKRLSEMAERLREFPQTIVQEKRSGES
jgi:lon-related putative ATP-dependent protease